MNEMDRKEFGCRLRALVGWLPVVVVSVILSWQTELEDQLNTLTTKYTKYTKYIHAKYTKYTKYTNSIH